MNDNQDLQQSVDDVIEGYDGLNQLLDLYIY